MMYISKWAVQPLHLLPTWDRFRGGSRHHQAAGASAATGTRRVSAAAASWRMGPAVATLMLSPHLHCNTYAAQGVKGLAVVCINSSSGR